MAHNAKRIAKRSAPSGFVAPPPKRQSQADIQATMLTHIGWPPSKSVELRPVMLGMHAASGKSGSPAFHEARTLLGAGACISRIRLFVKPICTAPSKSNAFQPAPRPRRGTCKSKNGFSMDKPKSACTLESSEWMREWRQQKAMAADQEEEGSSDWASIPKCSGFCAHTSRVPWRI